MQQLSGQDAMFVHSEMDNFPQHIGATGKSRSSVAHIQAQTGAEALGPRIMMDITDLVPDPAFYAECMQESFDELKAAALQ